MKPRIVTVADVAEHDGHNGATWTVVDGDVYDVSEYIVAHPGGSAIRLGAGRDATELFESHHPGGSLARARRVLRRRGKHVGTLAPADTPDYGDPSFFHAVRERVATALERRGLTYHSRSWILDVEAVIVLVLATLLWYGRVFLGSYLAAVLAGVVMARMGFLMHTSNHVASGGRSIRDRARAHLMEFIGGSSIIWRYAHQVAHHTHPNVLGRDNDCETGVPLLRFHPGLKRRPWHRIQNTLLFIGMSFGMLKWIIGDIGQLCRGRVVNVAFHVTRRELATALAWKVAWLFFNVAVPVAVLGPVHGIVQVFILTAVGGYYMNAVFIVNHHQEDLVPPTAAGHWAIRQVQGTANWSSGSRWANFVSGGLNHQVEHHLFPSMSVNLYPLISPVVRRTCEEFGLRYRDFPGFFVALWGTVTHLRDLGRPDPSDTELPLPARARAR